MILQNCVNALNIDVDSSFLYRGCYALLGEKICVNSGMRISSDTYMNGFDIGFWRKYTEINDIEFFIQWSGKSYIRILVENRWGIIKDITHGLSVYTDKEKNYIGKCFIPDEYKNGIVYFVLDAIDDVIIHCAGYSSSESAKSKDVNVAVVMCTYHRREALVANLKVLSAANCKLNRHFPVYVVDNASELSMEDLMKDLKEELKDDFKLFHNPNTGGSGGFQRGMREAILAEGRTVTHVLLMDDDVSICEETFYRLYALLSNIREKYCDEVVAGRMFRNDNKNIQYTAAEVWNGGDLKHVGYNIDTTDRECLWHMNDNRGAQYSGWWFAVFPADYVRKNEPLPFFIHCDDVEYGLRHGGNPIILNGIQVWHDTYDKKQNNYIIYYDIRNRLIVNRLYGLYADSIQGRESVNHFLNLAQKHNEEGDYDKAGIIITALWDYLRGDTWFRKNDVTKNHKKVCCIKGSKGKNAIRIFMLHNKMKGMR